MSKQTVAEARTVLVISNTLEVGGAEKQAIELSNLLVDSFAVILVVLNGERIEEKNLRRVSEKVAVKRLNGGVLKQATALTALMARARPLAVFSFMFRANLFGALGESFVRTHRFYPSIRSSYLPPWKRIVERRIISTVAAKVIFNSRKALESCWGAEDGKAIVVHNCVAMEDQIKRHGGSAPVTIVSVGRFLPVKDLKTAIDAFAMLIEGGDEARLRIVGYGPLEGELREYIQEMRVQDFVSLVVSPSSVQAELIRGDVFLSTSLHEGLSNALLEAAASGLPLVATDVGDSAAIVKPDVNGYLHRVGDVSGICGSLRSLIRDPHLRTRYGEASFQMVAARFSQMRFRQRYMELIS